jgi:hypothetical protein
VQADALKPRPTTAAGRALKAATARADKKVTEWRREKEQKEAAKEQREADDASFVGRRLRVFWPDDDAFYPGAVTAFRGGKHEVRYDDGDREWLKLREQRVKWVGGRRGGGGGGGGGSKSQSKKSSSSATEKTAAAAARPKHGVKKKKVKVVAVEEAKLKSKTTTKKKTKTAETTEKGTDTAAADAAADAAPAPAPAGEGGSETKPTKARKKQRESTVKPPKFRLKKKKKKKATLRDAVASVLRGAGDEGMTCPQIAEAVAASGHVMKGKTPCNSVFGVMSAHGGVGGTFRRISPGRYALRVGGGGEVEEEEEEATNAGYDDAEVMMPPPPHLQPRPPPPPDVRVLLIAVEGDEGNDDDASNDPGYVCAALVPNPSAVSPRGSENKRWTPRRALHAGTVEGVGAWGVRKRKRRERDDLPVLKYARHMTRLRELARDITVRAVTS